MSQESPLYNALTPVTVEAFKNRRCSLPKTDPNYLAPTPEEVKSLRSLLGFPQARLGDLVGKTYSKKGCKAVRRWETATENKESVPIDYCAWQLMLLAAGVISIDERIEASLGYKAILNDIFNDSDSSQNGE